MDAVKEILFQVLIASLPAFLFPLTYEKVTCSSQQNGSSGQRETNVIGLLYTTILSMFLCSLFDCRLWDVIPLNFAILPLFAFMLYGKIRHGLMLAGLQLVLYSLFAVNYTFFEFILETGVLLFPFVLLTSTFFRSMNRLSKVAILSVFFMMGEFMIAAIPFLSGSMTLTENLSALIALFSSSFIALLAGILFVLIIENTLEKVMLREQVTQLSHKYFREAEKLQQMIDAAPLSIILLDQQGFINLINDAFLQLYRKEHQEATREDLITRRISDAMNGIFIETMASEVQEKMEGSLKTTELLKSDDHIYFTSTSPIYKSETDELIGTVLIIQDITELETLRTELSHVERLSLVGQMAAGITHEIRNPMAVVRGFLQLMREKSPPTLDNYYRIVMEELDRANSIINDFLSLAQNRVTESEECHLHDIIHDLTPLLWADANLRGQSIEVRLGEYVPRMNLNPKEIKQLILNLARNGMEAMEEKGQLTLETRLTERGVELLVTDTGPGIPPKQQEKLFEPFYTTKAKGTGLGLALCLSILERHRSKITLQSEEGKGTTFTVLFPLADNGDEIHSEG